MSQSSGWAGYADIDKTYTEVSASWTEPTVTCGATTSTVAFWVGLGGYTSDTLLQAGTLVECYQETAYGYSWWESYPTNDVQIVGDTVQAGDKITASITGSGSTYTFKVTDSTHPANSFSVTQTCSDCTNTSAEWIVEAPSGSTGIYPIADYHSWTVTGATVKSGTVTGVISTFPYVDMGAGPLNPGGNGFTVTWTSAPPTLARRSRTSP